MNIKTLIVFAGILLSTSGCSFRMNLLQFSSSSSSNSTSALPGSLTWLTQLGATTHAPSNPVNANQGNDVCEAVAADSSGNVYCAGYTDGNLGEVNGGGADAFVMKTDSSGVVLWITQLGAATHAPSNPANANQGGDFCYAVAVDGSGNVFCAGSTSGNLGEVSGGSTDVFVMKLDSSGTIQWITQLGATTHASQNPVNVNQGSDEGLSIAVDGGGNVYCGGSTSGNLSEVNAGGQDAFVMKLDSSGALQWVTQLGAATHAPQNPVNANQGDEYCFGIAVDGSGNVYCAGMTSGNLSEVNAGLDDAFVMKLDSSGAIQWVTQLGATTHAPSNPANVNQGDDECSGVAVDGSGNVFCAGDTTGNLSEVLAGSDDAFVMKLDSSGAVQWLTQLGSTTHAPSNPINANQGGALCNGVATDASGNVYCAGTTAGNTGEVNAGSNDAFAMMLSPSGIIQWLTQLGATTQAASNPTNVNQGFDQCLGVAVDASGNTYCAGSTSGNLSETNAGSSDLFLMKLHY